MTDKGEVSLPKPVFTIATTIGSNQRIKSKDVSIIEQALCHLLVSSTQTSVSRRHAGS